MTKMSSIFEDTLKLCLQVKKKKQEKFKYYAIFVNRMQYSQL